MVETPKPQSKEEKSSLLVAIKLAWDLGYIIAIPAVLFGFGGAYLDKYYGTTPFLMLAGFIIAITLSGLGVARKVRRIVSDTEASPR
jgi:F0F1-type ATP synthase assembly protein I